MLATAETLIITSVKVVIDRDEISSGLGILGSLTVLKAMEVNRVIFLLLGYEVEEYLQQEK